MIYCLLFIEPCMKWHSHIYIKKTRPVGERPPPRHCIKKPQPSRLRKPPKPWLHPVGLHGNLGRPQPTVLATTATTPGRRVQTNHKCHRPAPYHYILGCQRFHYYSFFATTRIWTLVGVFLNWEAYHYITGVLVWHSHIVQHCMFFLPTVHLTFCNLQLDWWKGYERTRAGWYYFNTLLGIARMCNKGAFISNITVQLLLHILIYIGADVKCSDSQLIYWYSYSFFRQLKLLLIPNQMDHT